MKGVAEENIIPYEEWLALESFYLSTNGLHWNKNKYCINRIMWNFTDYLLNNSCKDQ